MNPNSTQKRIAFGYNRNYGKIVLTEGQAAAVKLIFMYYLEGKSLKDAVKDSVAASKNCRAQIIKLEFSYLGHLLIGLLSLGVLLVIRCAPKISVSYFVFCNRVFEKDACRE